MGELPAGAGVPVLYSRGNDDLVELELRTAAREGSATRSAVGEKSALPPLDGRDTHCRTSRRLDLERHAGAASDECRFGGTLEEREAFAALLPRERTTHLQAGFGRGLDNLRDQRFVLRIALAQP